MKWCEAYIRELREICLEKFDDVCVDILTYFESYQNYTEEEKHAILTGDNNGGRTAANLIVKPSVNLIEQSPDLLFGLWCNSGNKNMAVTPIDFDNHYQTNVPAKNMND